MAVFSSPFGLISIYRSNGGAVGVEVDGEFVRVEVFAGVGFNCVGAGVGGERHRSAIVDVAGDFRVVC